MPQQQLNLLRLTARLAAELRAPAAQIMARECASRGGAGVMNEPLPDGFLIGDEFTSHPPLFTARKIFPSQIFAARVHASILTFTAAVW